MTTAIEFHSIKGGVGTTTIVAALAVHYANAGRDVTVYAKDPGDMAATLGLPQPLHSEIVYSASGNTNGLIALLLDPPANQFHTDLILADNVVVHPSFDPTVWHVVRNDYVGLRRLAALPPDGTNLVSVIVDGGALRRADIDMIRDAPHHLSIPVDINVARTLDAGMLTGRMPTTLAAFCLEFDRTMA